MSNKRENKTPSNAWSRPGSILKKEDRTNNGSSTAHKILEAQNVKLQAAVKKYANEYESSTDEEDLESDTVISSILKSYSETGGKTELLGRTQAFIEESFHSGAAICLICISTVKRNDSIWNCKVCYCCFHLNCIQRWSKDTVTQQKQALNELPLYKPPVTVAWGCPKCRHEYSPSEIPDKYVCFCQKVVNPPFQLLIAPHSCGETCEKALKPLCGHNCLLLCHPGPCPPCPQTVKNSCYCGKQPPKLQRCSNKFWSCGGKCQKILSCGKHTCTKPCHDGDCLPCNKKSVQKCECGLNQCLRDCAFPIWQCERVCKKQLNCGKHSCNTICHKGDCGPCEFTKPRSCPCGKSSYVLPCTEETPTCGDTCGKPLECGSHICNQRCHKDKCGVCLETITKSCRCGLHTKEVQCKKVFLCETKCKQMKDCNKHLCNRKCCDNNCPPCEKPCNRTLSCGNHKCASVCHRGPCYPCSLTEEVKCRCLGTTLIVPCGRKNKTKPPKCSKLCLIPPDCHHSKREEHKCHFGDCPACRQICNKSRENCSHLCVDLCHSAVVVRTESQKASMPWEQTGPHIEVKSIPCPDCTFPVLVTCLGGHETCDWPCYLAKSSSCHRPCGRKLVCGNHFCNIPCHTVLNNSDEYVAGSNCEECNSGCTKPRPEGCNHLCPKSCHPGDCPPCKQMIRIKCHCSLSEPYVNCHEWTSTSRKEELQSCNNQCPKNYSCGHRCRANCHSGPCPDPDQCKKKVKVFCACRRLKKEFSCETVRKNLALMECDDACKRKLEEDKKLHEREMESKKKEELERNQRELEQFQKKFLGKKKNRERRRAEEREEKNFLQKYWIIFPSLAVLILAVYYITL